MWNTPTCKGDPENKTKYDAVNADEGSSLIKSWEVIETQWDVLMKAWELLEWEGSIEKMKLPRFSSRIEKFLDVHNIVEQNISELMSLINEIWEYIFYKKLETKGRKLKLEIEDLLKNDEKLKDIFSRIIRINNSEKEVDYSEISLITVDKLEYERRLIGQYKRNKNELLERLKNSQDINIWWDKNLNDIASLTLEELIEIFSCTQKATWFDFSTYNLDLLTKEQLIAIFSNFNNAITVNLEGAIFNINNDKLEIVFKNLQNCESLNYTMNKVTLEGLVLMKKYLKNIKSIDFTMCDLTQQQLEYVNREFSNVDICLDWLDDGIDLDIEWK